MRTKSRRRGRTRRSVRRSVRRYSRRRNVPLFGLNPPKRRRRSTRKARKSRRTARRNPWYGHRPEHRTASNKGWGRRRRHVKGYARPRGGHKRRVGGKRGYAVKFPIWRNGLSGLFGGVKDVFNTRTIIEGALIAAGAVLTALAVRKLVPMVIKNPVDAAKWSTGWQGAIVQLALAGLIGGIVGSLLRKPALGRQLMIGGVVGAAIPIVTSLGQKAGFLTGYDSMIDSVVGRHLEGMGDYLNVPRLMAAQSLGDTGDYYGADDSAAPELGFVGEGEDWDSDAGLEMSF